MRNGVQCPVRKDKALRSGKDGGPRNEHVVSRNVAIPDTAQANSGELAVHEKDAPCGGIRKRQSELPLGGPGKSLIASGAQRPQV